MGDHHEVLDYQSDVLNESVCMHACMCVCVCVCVRERERERERERTLSTLVHQRNGGGVDL